MESNGRLKRDRLASFAFFALGIGCFLLAGFLVYLFSGKFVNTPSGMRAGPALSLSQVSAVTESAPAVLKEPPAARKAWVLYVTGEVLSPGVYHLPPESRVFQLIEAAGGLTQRADPVQVNLAAPLDDGMHIHVPALLPPAPVLERKPGDYAAPSPGKSSSAVVFPRASQPAVLRSAPQPAAGGRVNVNMATAAELESLPGVGPAIARSIMECRETLGRFSCVEDLLKVKGIGAKKLEAMRGFIAIQ